MQFVIVFSRIIIHQGCPDLLIDVKTKIIVDYYKYFAVYGQKNRNTMKRHKISIISQYLSGSRTNQFVLKNLQSVTF